jgi:hypothetical protein
MAQLKSGTRIYGDATLDNKLQVTSGPVLVGSATSTGTALQRLQVTGGAHISDNVGIGTTNPTEKLQVLGNVKVTNSTSAIQDAVVLAGRAGGTGSFAVTLTPTTLSSSRTLTLPNATGTFVTTGDSATVTNTMLSTVATSTFKGRTTAGTGAPEDLSTTQATALLDTFTSTLKGLVPGSSGGGTTNFLRADGTWAAPAGGDVTLAGNNAFTGANTFTNATGQTIRSAATQDGIILSGRAGGTGSFAATLTPTTLSASRTITLPDANTTIPVATQVLTFSGPTAARTITLPDANFTAARTDATQTFTAAQTFRAANAVRSEAASTQDAVVLAGRAGGTTSLAVTITPTTLTASRTLTLPDTAGTVITTGDSATVTNTMLSTVATSTIRGRTTAGTGVVENLTGTQATTLLDTFTSTAKGLAPLSGGGTTNFLRADGTWAAPPSSGGGVTDGDKGDISVASSGATWTIDNNAVTLAKMQQISTAKVLGRTTAATGNVEQLSTTGTGNVVFSASPILSGNLSLRDGSAAAVASKLHLQELSADTTIRITSGGLTGGGSINDWEITNFNANNTLSITNSSTARLSITTGGNINFTGSLYENNQKVPSLGVTLAASYGMFMP